MIPEHAHQLLQKIAQEAVPDSADVWPSIRAQVVEKGSVERGAKRFMRKSGAAGWHSRGMVFALIGSLAIVVIAAGVLGLSSGQGSKLLVFDLNNLLVQDTTPTTSVTASSTMFVVAPPSSTPLPAPTAVATMLNSTARPAADEAFGTQSMVLENTPLPDTFKSN